MMKLSALCLLMVVCYACAAQQPSAPTVSLVVEKIATTSSGCQVKVSVFNNTDIAWHVVHFGMAFRDSSSNVIGEYRDTPAIYTEPGRGILDNGTVQGIGCEAIASVSLIEFNYLTEYRLVSIEASSIPISIQ